jgi:NTE family protein
MGALVGAAHVAGRLAELRQWAETATWRKIARLTDLRLAGGGLITGRQVVAFLRGMGIGEPIGELFDPVRRRGHGHGDRS